MHFVKVPPPKGFLDRLDFGIPNNPKEEPDAFPVKGPKKLSKLKELIADERSSKMSFLDILQLKPKKRFRPRKAKSRRKFRKFKKLMAEALNDNINVAATQSLTDSLETTPNENGENRRFLPHVAFAGPHAPLPTIPVTHFTCVEPITETKRIPGFYADLDAFCQVKTL